MSIELKVPSLGESVQQAMVGAWLKQEGEPVALDEPIVEVESEKATVAVPSPIAGVLTRQLHRTGDAVGVGEVLGVLEADASAPIATPTAAPAPTTIAIQSPTDPTTRRPTPSERRRLAEAPALPAPAAAPPPATARPPSERERLVPMTPLRRTVARRLLDAQASAAILTTFNEVDMSRVLALRERHGPAFLEKHGVKLGFMSIFVKAAVGALQEFPAVNAEVRGDAVLYKDHYDIGVAVGGGKGLVVPVVRDADRLTFAEVELAVHELARKARENRITTEDLAGATFTISNGGVYGSLLSTPILNPPQSGLLGLHKIEKRAVVLEGDVLAARPMMYLALSYDHRLVDGREAVGFLVRVKQAVEEPERLLFGL